MKKFALVLVAVFTVSTVRAQLFGIGLGYNFNFISPDSLNYIIDEYNKRTFLTTKMKHVSGVRGLALNLHGSMKNIYWTTAYNWMRARAFAEADDSIRQLRLKMDTWDLGMGLVLQSGPLIVVPGATIELGNVKTQTRKGDDTDIKKRDWITPTSDLNLYSRLFCSIIIGGEQSLLRLFLEPYYRFAFFNIELIELNKEFNPGSWILGPPEIRQKFPHFGVRVMLALVLSS